MSSSFFQSIWSIQRSIVSFAYTFRLNPMKGQSINTHQAAKQHILTRARELA